MKVNFIKIGAGPIWRSRELRIGHQDEKMKVSIKTIFKERGTFSSTDNGLQWAYSIQWCLMEKRSFSPLQ